MLDPELAGYPEKVEAKNPLDDEIMKKFLDQETVEKDEVFLNFYNYFFLINFYKNSFEFGPNSQFPKNVFLSKLTGKIIRILLTSCKKFFVRLPLGGESLWLD